MQGSDIKQPESHPLDKAMSKVTIDSTPSWSCDQVIADELGKLSLREREKAYEDVHGISNPVEETPDLVESSLHDMEAELARIAKKPAYDIASQLSPTFVSDRKFRLGFLRAEMFDVHKAAVRMTKYFELKLELFGKDKLAKIIEWDDLESPTQKAVARGSLSILPSRDALGRAVIVSIPACHLAQHMIPSVMPKALWYLMNSVTEDEESQKKGFVVVYYALGPKIDKTESSESTRKIGWAAGEVGRYLPVRVSSFHHCYENRIGQMINVFTVVASPFLRVRMRAHQGTHSECQYKLLTFGIPVKDFPINTQGQLKTAKHKGWVERRRQKEKYMRNNEIPEGAVDLPVRYDVLLGKGMPCQEHPGNKRLHELVAMRYEEYNSAKRDRKTEIAEELVVQVNRSSGRFLKRDEASGMWIEAPLKEAREKVCHGFRRKREWDLKRGPPAPTEAEMSEEVGGQKKFKWSF